MLTRVSLPLFKQNLKFYLFQKKSILGNNTQLKMGSPALLTRGARFYAHWVARKKLQVFVEYNISGLYFI
jgi:hypothetical protein